MDRFRLGLEIANFPLKFSEVTLNRFRQYPFWYPASLLLISSTIFFSIWRPCQAPAVTFILTTTKSSGAIQPNVVLNAEPNAMMIFSVNPVNGATIGCTWNRAGNGIAHLSQTSGCTSTVWLSPDQGAAILTVAVNEGICPNQDVYSFPIMIRKP